MKKTKIAIIGIRGIPVIYSGFESFAELLGEKLLKKRFEIWSYNRSLYCVNNKKIHKGINLITLPTIKSKNFETLLHSFVSTIHAIFFLKPDIIYYFGVGNAIFTFLPRLFGIKTVINVDGLDWKRKKWNMIVRLYLKLSEYLAIIFPNVTITDSNFMKKYYLKNYEKNIVYIPYGFDERLKTMGKKIESKTLKYYRLKKYKYFIWVGRLVPDNNLEELIYAFKKLKTNYKCVIVGDDLYKSKYKDFITKIAKDDERIILTGFLQREKYAILIRNSFCYIETKRSGGLHPSFLEAISLVKRIIVNNILWAYLKKDIKKIKNYNHVKTYNVNNFMSLKSRLEYFLKLDRSSFVFKCKNNYKPHKLFTTREIILKYVKLFRSLEKNY